MQTPSVWASLAQSFSERKPGLALFNEDLTKRDFDGFEHWTQDFCRRVEEQGAGEKSFLLGYSLGGRLALQASVERPDLWLGVVVVGADPGLNSKMNRKRQLQRDRAWAERARKEPLKKLMEEWDEQPVFVGIPNSAPRRIEELNSLKISRQFEVFSKGHQRNLGPELAVAENPSILFLSGEKDEKYSAIGKKLALSCKCVEFKLISEAGHRVPWENPDEFFLVVSTFMEACLE